MYALDVNCVSSSHCTEYTCSDALHIVGINPCCTQEKQTTLVRVGVFVCATRTVRLPALAWTRPAGTRAGIDSCTCANGSFLLLRLFLSLFLPSLSCSLFLRARLCTMNRASAIELWTERESERTCCCCWLRAPRWIPRGTASSIRRSYDQPRGLLTVHPVFRITFLSFFSSHCAVIRVYTLFVQKILRKRIFVIW